MFMINRKIEAESLISEPLLAALFGLIGIMTNLPLAQAPRLRLAINGDISFYRISICHVKILLMKESVG